MLHPTLPYITEELYQRLPHIEGQAPESICIAPFPEKLVSFKSENVEGDMDDMHLFVSKLRSQFASLKIPKSIKPKLTVNS
jgi:valyl-tRNA synthetase